MFTNTLNKVLALVFFVGIRTNIRR